MMPRTHRLRARLYLVKTQGNKSWLVTVEQCVEGKREEKERNGPEKTQSRAPVTSAAVNQDTWSFPSGRTVQPPGRRTQEGGRQHVWGLNLALTSVKWALPSKVRRREREKGIGSFNFWTNRDTCTPGP